MKRKKVTELHRMLISDGEEPKADPIYQSLERRRTRFLRARELLYNHKKTAFIFVTIAEKLPILETKKAVELLKEVKIPIYSILVNRILPDSEISHFLQKRKEQEQRYVNEIKSIFKKEHLHYIPLLDHDIYGIEHLQRVATYLFKREDYKGLD